jgi:hypothetical protein
MNARLALACSLALVSTLAAADHLYKWVDKDGHVHFSQTPPAGTGVQAQSVDVNAPPPDPTGLRNSQALQQQLADKDKKAKEEAEKNKPDPHAEALKKQHCDDLKSRLSTLQNSGRAATVDAQGNMNYLDDAARAKEEQEIESEIKSDCGS